jgi:transporter family-2 protein
MLDLVMKNPILIGALVTLLTGAAIGIQATLNGVIGSEISPIRTGLWMNFVGGAIAGVILLLFFRGANSNSGTISPSILMMLAIAGTLGIVVITGVSFSIARTGVAAALGGMFLGQLIIGTLVDTFGWGIYEAVPINPTRLIGLLLMAFSVYLLLPRS